jgi:hypothetical protein
MGKAANERAHREWERQQNRQQDTYFEAEPEPSDDEREQIASDDYWAKLDASPVRHVRLWDDLGRAV